MKPVEGQVPIVVLVDYFLQIYCVAVVDSQDLLALSRLEIVANFVTAFCSARRPIKVSLLLLLLVSALTARQAILTLAWLTTDDPLAGRDRPARVISGELKRLIGIRFD